MDRQERYRISLSDVSNALFSSQTHLNKAPSLLSLYKPALPVHLFSRTSEARTVPSVSHDSWFGWDKAQRTARGILTRNRIVELIHEAGDLAEQKDLDDMILDAVYDARAYRRPMYVDPSFINAPDLCNIYVKRSWTAPGVKFASFRPALLEVEYRDNEWTLQVISIKSTHDRAHYFMEKVLNAFRRSVKRDKGHPFHRLSMATYPTLWRYSGCYSSTCSLESCILNRAAIKVKNYDPTLSVGRIKKNTSLVMDTLFEAVPDALGARVESISSSSSSDW
ncbi:hypothetical protein JCM8547_003012 [Rhodosporidiobolus lusitaniae]